LIPISAAYKNGNKSFTLTTIEPRLSFDDQENISSETYLSEILNNNPKLFHYINLGYQSYYNSPAVIKYLSEKYETVRLGISSDDIRINEPLIRDSDILGINIESVRQCDAPGTGRPSVNGYYGEDICQLARYAGISEKISTFCLFNVLPDSDEKNRTSSLSAQIVWCFLNSFNDRKNESPKISPKKFQKLIVNVEGVDEGIVFYKSLKSQRWWVEINYVINNDERTRVISCTQEDYLKAAKNEIPERWWKFYQKFNKFK
jgi:formiminoglutamase